MTRRRLRREPGSVTTMRWLQNRGDFLTPGRILRGRRRFKVSITDVIEGEPWNSRAMAEASSLQERHHVSSWS